MDRKNDAESLLQSVREAMVMCPHHGVALVPAPVTDLSAPVRKCCPCEDCNYKVSARTHG